MREMMKIILEMVQTVHKTLEILNENNKKQELPNDLGEENKKLNENNKKLEEEIKILNEKNKTLEEGNKRYEEGNKDKIRKFIKKILKLSILMVLIIGVFWEIDNLADKYYESKNKYPSKDCYEIEKNCTIKEAESQKKIAELEKEICGLKEKLNKPLPKQTIKNQPKNADGNKSIIINQSFN